MSPNNGTNVVDSPNAGGKKGETPGEAFHTNGFREEVLRIAGQETATCIQCGSCSASCSNAAIMGSSIRKLIGMVLDGRRDDALNSRSIWLCTSCLLCTVRCPRGIRPKSVVSALKYICEKEGRSSPDQAMESLFMDQVRESGRVNELLVSISFQRFEPKAALQSMEMGLELISKGKISIGQDRIKAIAEIKRLFSELQQE